MRNYSKTVGALAAASTLVAGYASAEIEGEVHVGYHNMYEFRFVDLGTDLAEGGVDVSFGEWGGFSVAAGAWYGSWNDDLTGAGDELDLYASVGYEVGPVSLEAGYIYYYFPNASPAIASNTQEVYLGASFEIVSGLSFGSTWYYDFDQNNGWYWDNNLSYSISFNDCLGLDLAAGVAFADGHGLQASKNAIFGPNPGSTADGYQGFYLSAALPWEFREGVTLSPYVKYTNADGGLVTDFPKQTSFGKDYIVAGLTLAVGF